MRTARPPPVRRRAIAPTSTPGGNGRHLMARGAGSRWSPPPGPREISPDEAARTGQAESRGASEPALFGASTYPHLVSVRDSAVDGAVGRRGTSSFGARRLEAGKTAYNIHLRGNRPELYALARNFVFCLCVRSLLEAHNFVYRLCERSQCARLSTPHTNSFQLSIALGFGFVRNHGTLSG